MRKKKIQNHFQKPFHQSQRTIMISLQVIFLFRKNNRIWYIEENDFALKKEFTIHRLWNAKKSVVILNIYSNLWILVTLT